MKTVKILSTFLSRPFRVFEDVLEDLIHSPTDVATLHRDRVECRDSEGWPGT
jgi:hypothetical protein